MNDADRRRAWLEGIAARVPRLFDKIAEGNVEAGFQLGEKRVGDRRVQLALIARVVEGAPKATDSWEVLPPLANPVHARAEPPPARHHDAGPNTDEGATPAPRGRARRRGPLAPT